MFPTNKNFEGYCTWHQMVVRIYGEKDIRSGISILEAVARPVNPGRALRLASRLLDLFGRLPPEVVEAVTFFYLQGIERVEDPSVFCEVVAPNFEDLKRLRIALIEAIFNSLVNMP
ncbi:uncharacterized protein LOC141525787 isoform X2 [Cotesia typhae]|uniref:uncharacterized protein LOC141525787 isoform X2 n=1 Tax=Cotesia typhae TaxID=2053667 RepID=UPI003D683367